MVSADMAKDRKDKARQELRENREPDQQVTGSPSIPEAPRRLPTQEMDLVRVMITGGDKLIQVGEETTTVANYLLSNLEEEVIQEFNSPLLRAVMEMASAQLRSDAPLTPQFFLQSDREDIRDLAIGFLSPDYQYSDNWEERYQIVLHTQRMPDDNFARDAQLALQRFQLHRLDQMCSVNAQRIKEAYDTGDEPLYLHYLKFQQELQALRNSIADQDLNTVILK